MVRRIEHPAGLSATDDDAEAWITHGRRRIRLTTSSDPAVIAIREGLLAELDALVSEMKRAGARPAAVAAAVRELLESRNPYLIRAFGEVEGAADRWPAYLHRSVRDD